MGVSRRPRILRIIARLNTGGPARHVTLLSRGLEKKGYPHLLVAGRVGKEEGSLESLAKATRINFYGLPWMGPEIHPGQDMLSLFQLIFIIRQFRPDIVHTHTAKAGFLGRLAAFLCGVPHIFHTYHGHVLHGYFSRPKQGFYRILETLAGKISTRLITLTEGLAAELADLGVAARKKFAIIPLGLDLSPFLEVQAHAQVKAQLQLDPKTTLVGCIGRLVPVKNLGAILEAMAALEGNIHLVLVGDGEDRKSLEEKSRKWGLNGRVHFYGWCENLAWMYGGLDLVVNCSRNEGTPVSILEALVAGVPILAAPVGGIPELVRQVGAGTLMEGISPVEILRGLQGVLRNLPAQKPTQEKRRSIVEIFSVESLVTRIEELYQKGAPVLVPNK